MCSAIVWRRRTHFNSKVQPRERPLNGASSQQAAILQRGREVVAAWVLDRESITRFDRELGIACSVDLLRPVLPSRLRHTMP
jgi:hypothetical protein